ncbi:hypothetical protein [Streptomyces sp. TRM75563]|uniref:hypothetical protein n=1 Tax=Streptomyces sp. TRM75563 TaxID=2817418 RepID=UPI001F61FD5E|nr:hypothetical protein [Streptomyces sp. TRM75563]MCI4045708.1 hypothetical protein [Streptomyces sp. TRM75563]
MPHRIPAAPFEVESLIPELVGLGRETTLLYPRSGEPGVRSSSIGGPLLWPADEPWPLCTEPRHWKPLRTPTEVVGPEAVAMVPVVQLYARDVPELPFPAGLDVLQVVWCPLIHDDEVGAALPKVYWRSERTVAAGGMVPNPPAPYEYEEEFVPRPCTVTPTRVVEYPNRDLPGDLAQALSQRFGEIEDTFGFSYYELATTVQSKVGGYPGWLQQPDWPNCRCGRRMDHLLSITASEPIEGRWFPLDEQEPDSSVSSRRTMADHTFVDTIGHGMDMGDLGGVYLFGCPECPDMPYTHRYDC